MELVLEKGRPADCGHREEREVRCYDLLDHLGIEYQRVDHEAASTMEACRAVDEVLYPAVICKNLFLCNTQKTKFYLLMIREDKKFKTKLISKQINSARLSFAPEEFMIKYLDTLPGSCSVLGLMNDHDHQVQLLVDEDVLEAEYFGCHPCKNTSSIKVGVNDIFNRFLHEIDHNYIKVTLENE